MSFLLERPSTPARPGSEPPPSPFAAPLHAALRAAVGGLVPVAVPVVVAWVLGAGGGQAGWDGTVRLTLALWLLGHHTGLVIEGGHVGLVPLGLALVPLASTWLAGRRLARIMDPRAERIAAGATRAAPARLSGRSLGLFAGAYTLIVALASLAAAMPGLRPVSAQAVLGAVTVALLGGGSGAATYRHGGLRRAVLAAERRIPAPVRHWVRPAATALTAQLVVASAVVVALIAVHASQVMAVHRALRPGVSGTAVLTLGEVLLIPNLVLWAASALVGVGFAVGAGTWVGLTGSHLGPLPAIPVLAALPVGPLPGAVTGLLAVPVLAGALGGRLLVRRGGDATPRELVTRAAGTGLLAGVGGGLLAWLSGGPAGPGRFAVVGPSALLVGVTTALEVGFGALATVLVVVAWPRFQGATWWARLRDAAEAVAAQGEPAGPEGGEAAGEREEAGELEAQNQLDGALSAASATARPDGGAALLGDARTPGGSAAAPGA